MKRSPTCALFAMLTIASCRDDILFDDLTTCTLDADCLLPSLHCNAGQCVACTSDAHCTTPGFPRCDVAMHRCVQCGVSADCTNGGTCHTGECLTSCSAGCPSAFPICDDQVCGQCDDDVVDSCAGSPSGPICFEHFCGTCKDDTACKGATPRCDPVTHQCVQCQASGDCSSSAPLCDPVAGRCVAPP